MSKSLSKNTIKHNSQVEGLRGFAALGVMFAHGLGFDYFLDDSYKISGIVPYFSLGGLAVLLFFLISGYVIGLSKQYENNYVASFYKKRLVRLYPIYFISFLLVYLITGFGEISTLQLIGNFLFLQNDYGYFGFSIPVLPNNPPIWSLHYEVFYYLLFPLIIFFNLKVIRLIVSVFLVAFLGNVFKILPIFLINLLLGYTFWLIGFLISKIDQTTQKNTLSPDLPFSFISYAFLLISSHHLSAGSIIIRGLGLNNLFKTTIWIEYMFFLPLCCLVIIEALSISTRLKNWLKVYSYLLPLLIFIYLLVQHRLFENYRWLACLLFYFLSILFFYEKEYSRRILIFFSKLGSISYAIYLFHTPLGALIKLSIPLAGTPVTFLIKFFLWILITFFTSYLAEIYLQPKLKNYFFRKRNNKPAI